MVSNVFSIRLGARMTPILSAMAGFIFNAAFARQPVMASDTVAASKLKVIAFGDSTTAPRGKLNVYACQVQQHLAEKGIPVDMINAGVGGNHTVAAMKRFENDVLRHRADVVIIQFGINDAAVDVWKEPPATSPRVPLGTYRKNLQHFVSAIHSQGGTPILMTPNPLRWTSKLKKLYGKRPYDSTNVEGLNPVLKDYVAVVRTIAEERDVTLVDVYHAFQEYGQQAGQSTDDLLLDGMHPNEKGHHLVSEFLVPLIKNQIREDRTRAE